jgi:hypothetical protein
MPGRLNPEGCVVSSTGSQPRKAGRTESLFNNWITAVKVHSVLSGWIGGFD